jgi:hypothetical protein
MGPDPDDHDSGKIHTLNFTFDVVLELVYRNQMTT